MLLSRKNILCISFSVSFYDASISNILDTSAINFRNIENFHGCLTKGFFYSQHFYEATRYVDTPVLNVYNEKSINVPRFYFQEKLYFVTSFFFFCKTPLGRNKVKGTDFDCCIYGYGNLNAGNTL